MTNTKGTIIAASIGALGVIIAAIIGSPIIASIINDHKANVESIQDISNDDFVSVANEETIEDNNDGTVEDNNPEILIYSSVNDFALKFKDKNIIAVMDTFNEKRVQITGLITEIESGGAVFLGDFPGGLSYVACADINKDDVKN